MRRRRKSGGGGGLQRRKEGGAGWRMGKKGDYREGVKGVEEGGEG